MLVNESIRLAKKMVAILEQIQIVSNRIARFQADLNVYDNSGPLVSIKLFKPRSFYTDQIAKDKRELARLRNLHLNKIETILQQSQLQLT